MNKQSVLSILLALFFGLDGRVATASRLRSRRMATMINCPMSEEEGSLNFTDRFIEIGSSPTLCTLVEAVPEMSRQTTDLGWFIKPIGRSYSGKHWEVAAGDFTSKVGFECIPNSTCSIELPPLANGSVYQLTTFDHPNYSDRDIAARFLEQTTFGQTKAQITELLELDEDLSAGMVRWIEQQLDPNQTSIMSHREIFRSRMNAKYEHATPIGPVTQPCQAGTRYRRSLFSIKDKDKIVSFEFFGDRLVLGIEGFPHTVLSSKLYDSMGLPLDWQAGKYRVCHLLHDRDVYFDHPENGCTRLTFQDPYDPTVLISNPPIHFDDEALLLLGIEPNVVLDITTESFQYIDQALLEELQNPLEEIILKQELQDLQCKDLIPPVRYEGPVFGRTDNFYWIHDPRFKLFSNTVTNPLIDGGGEQFMRNANVLDRRFSPKCSNVPRDFLNEDDCYLSDSAWACSADTSLLGQNEVDLPVSMFKMTHEAMRTIYTASGAGDHGTVYLYAIRGLNITLDQQAPRPCDPGRSSRWLPIACSGAAAGVDAEIQAIFRELIDVTPHKSPEDKDFNPYLLDVYYPPSHVSCSKDVSDQSGFEIEDSQGRCWLNTHPDELNVYDFAHWVTSHPGNTDLSNPILDAAKSNNTVLLFPESHELLRWQTSKDSFRGPWKLGANVNFHRLPLDLRTKDIAEVLSIDLAGSSSMGYFETTGPGTLVCGSPNEVATDPFLGGSQERGAFEAATDRFQTSYPSLVAQRQSVWMVAAMEDAGQLRQRIAWALAKILAVTPDALINGSFITECYLKYYDIFVRNAFGNYRDILKEVSYSPVMAGMLSYHGSRSTASVYEYERTVEFADENYAREIMQLFTTGLFVLNDDGTGKVGEDGLPLRVYTNSDIEEYARVWTGFVSQHARGNAEIRYDNNRIDPMRILEGHRDKFPKMGLNRVYIGDGYPLCADLPDKHFLAAGATYQLLGNTASPELSRDPEEWKTDSQAVFLSLDDPSSPLYGKLCEPDIQGVCNFQSKVVLTEEVPCTGLECEVDTVRSVHVKDGIYYEYVRPPCVQHAFYNNAKIVVPRLDKKNVMCADPRLTVAVPSCCDFDNDEGSWTDVYFGERTTFSTASNRCSEGQGLCERGLMPSCDAAKGTKCSDETFVWTSSSCKVQAMLNFDGRIAVVHSPDGVPDAEVASLVSTESKTFFRVDWSGDYSTIMSNCSAVASCSENSDGFCVCDVLVEERPAFASSVPSEAEILSELKIGGFRSSPGPSIDNYYEAVDGFGVRHFRKNMISTVNILGTSISFRNPVHFLDLADGEPRDAHYETGAALDHVFFNSNVAPFLGIRLLQHFGVSNPSPRYVARVGSAFRTGSYESLGGTKFGNGSYGDLAATIAALILDDEARDVVLDGDPTHGGLKEPLLKLTGLMRSLAFTLPRSAPSFPEFGEFVYSQLGQMAHSIPSVFSFFLPDYAPAGPVERANLVSPEAQLLTGPRIVDGLNGMLSLVKWGLTDCLGGFGKEGADCTTTSTTRVAGSEAEKVKSRTGFLAYEPEEGMSINDTIDDLATLMTAGRLSEASRLSILNAVANQTDAEVAVNVAQQIIAGSPEFSATNLVRRNKAARQPPPKQDSVLNAPYKAVVYVLLAGGMDSFQLLVPHSCEATAKSGRTLRDQYDSERSTIAITDEERTHIISANGQPCSAFAIHQDIPIVERLYNDNDLAFFANMGAIDEPISKDSYYRSTELFAHNTMQAEAQQLDPFQNATGTGILGRLSDVLLKKGYAAQSITVQDATTATFGGAPPMVLSARGVNKLNPSGPSPSSENLNVVNDYIEEVNEASELHTSVYGETWSGNLRQAIVDSNFLVNAMEDVSQNLTQDYQEGPKANAFLGKMSAISRIVLTNAARKAERDSIFVSLGQWDHHQGLKVNLAVEFKRLNKALEAFEQEMKANGLWDSVTVVVASDFARTLTPNSGEGSDHAYGGNYFMMGGCVKGGTIHGDYPDDISPQGPLSIGRGRLIPTLSWESMWNGVLEWFGLETDDELNEAMPNRRRTGTKLFTEEELFQCDPNSTTG